MNTQVSLNLPDEIYRQVEMLAHQSCRPIADILIETLEIILLPNTKPISSLSDAEIIALSQLRLQPIQEKRLSELLDHQQSGTITEIEKTELQAIIHIYEDRLLRQSQALNEGVRRGLIPPLQG